MPLNRAPGSLYSEQYANTNLVSDARAYRPNDMVIVRIVESTTATSSATTELERKHANSLKVPNLFGIEKTHQQFYGEGTTDGTVLGVTSDTEHDGKGTTQRSGVFQGSVAARVIQVLPNHYLIIQGYKDVQVNGERMRLHLSGIVNPLMIDKDHSVASTQVADLQVRYGGEGVVTAQQNPGLIARIINFLWPF